MSASLVGSEMCIRDRGGGGAYSGWCRTSSCMEYMNLPPHAHGAEASDSCLLYTSDAADDM
eukprot:12416752-Alexandrium_andersonii.AAC.1